MARFTDPDEARAFLNSLSDHPDRPGDTSKLHPQFALAMANSISDAREAGMPVRLMSGQREGNVTNSRYDRAGLSSHTYGLASDVEGIGLAGSDTAQKWRQIAQANGLSSPYDPRGSEWNHWQFGPKLENDPDLLGQLRQAHDAGDTNAMWSAYVPSSITPKQPFTPYKVASTGWVPPPVSHQPANLLNRGTGSQAPIAAQPAPATGSHEQFIRDYAQKIGVNPDLAVGIANAEGLRAWSASNPNAGSYVDRTAGVPWSFGDFQLNTRNGMGVDALKAGIDPRDPKQWQAADRFALDQMKSGGLAPWKGDSYAANWMKSGRPITGAAAPVSTAATAAEPGIGSGIPTPAQPNPAAVAAETPPPQNVGDWIKKGFTRPPPTTDAKGNPVQGKSPFENIASSFGGGKQGGQPAAEPAPASFAPVQDPMAALAGPSSQMFQAVSQAASRPLSWTSTPYGSIAGQQYGMPQGTTLNSRGDYYG